MKFYEIYNLVGHVPFISRRNAEYLYNLILTNELTDVLELGIAHGTATCYIAAALEELGRGSVTSVDLIKTKDHYCPSAENQVELAGLSNFVNIVRMKTGYTWFLHDEIVRNTTNDLCNEVYDLCIIDGPKNWTIDGAAFFFVDKLLKENGVIIFDDYNWTYSAVDSTRSETDGITHRTLSKPERDTPHIKEIFEFLVKQHPNYGKLELLDGGDWAVAHKIATNDKEYNFISRETTADIGAKLFRFLFPKRSRKSH